MYFVFSGEGLGGRPPTPPPAYSPLRFLLRARSVVFFALCSHIFTYTCTIEERARGDKCTGVGAGGGGRREAGVNLRARFFVFRAFLFGAITFSTFKRTFSSDPPTHNGTRFYIFATGDSTAVTR